jgi:hypothetical protein
MPSGNVNVLKYSPVLTSVRRLKSVQYVAVFILVGVHPDAEQFPDRQVRGKTVPIIPLAAM